MLPSARCALPVVLLYTHLLYIRLDKVLAGVLLVVFCGSVVYCILQIIAALRYLRIRPPTLLGAEPISILKPLAGLDLDLEPNLRTFFEQDYPSFEILFAVRSESDPATQVVSRLQREYSKIPSQLVITGEP
ncbi:MAG TPA: hypothetical protein VJP02_31220, partial [Candidatus Sulfotelmatobacter sp.]|nr:hypothetical protein [Candidatus Sulfotelmatobacter sp.]